MHIMKLDKFDILFHNTCMDKIYYLDNAATTKVFDEVFNIIKFQNQIGFYNPSAANKWSLEVKKTFNRVRQNISKELGGETGKLIFTSSATESNNTVFECLHLRKGQEILVSVGEHPAVYNAAHKLESKGFIVKDIPLNENGECDFEEFKKLMNSNVALVSIMHVSNETGAINDIKKFCEYAKQINPKVIFHSDGVQAFCKIKVNVKDLGVDLYTISAHKLYAPRGIAGLWIKKGVVIEPFLVGGGQEEGLRSSTENVSGAIAFDYSVSKLKKDFEKNRAKVLELNNQIVEALKNSEIAYCFKVNSFGNNSPYILSLSFDKIKGEVLMNMLESYGIIISTGSACSAKKAGNRILESMNLTNSQVVGSVRISFSPYEEYDLSFISNAIIECVKKLQSNNIRK